MPKGKGTYGSKVGRPPEKSKEYFGGGTVDARNRSQNIAFSDVVGGGGNQPEGYNPHLREVAPQDVMQSAEVYYKKGDTVKKTKPLKDKRVRDYEDRFFGLTEEEKRRKYRKMGKKYDEGGPTKRGKKRTPRGMTEDSHPGVDALRNKIIKNEGDYETGKIKKEKWKKTQTDLMGKLRTMRDK